MMALDLSLEVTLSLLVLLGLAAAEGEFALESAAFADGRPIPVKYAHHGVSGGKNISPPLEWRNWPRETKSFALACIDRHPIARNWVHWLAINIPKEVGSIAEGASGTAKMPKGAKELKNSFGELGWGGPEPPPGSGDHNYEFIIYALNVESLPLEANSSLAAFNRAIEGKVIAQAKLTGTFKR